MRNLEALQYKLDCFEGPLDLLLHLIAKNKLNINDIPIFELIEQYLSYVRAARELNLDTASEFLEMAARLVYIKTVSLLPVHEEAEELQRELVGELIEYRDAKLVAQLLAAQTAGFERIVRNPLEIEFDMTYERLHESYELMRSYLNAAGKRLRRLPPPVDSFKPIVAKKVVAVVDLFDIIINAVKSGQSKSIIQIFKNAKSRSELVASFLAILELVKKKRMYLEGDGEEAELIAAEGGEALDEYE